MFPGQGVAAPQVAEALASGGKLVEKAEEILEFPLRRDVNQIARRSKAVLPTRLAQPAIVVASLARWITRSDRDSFSMLTGHSLGQITALVAGEAVSLRRGLRLVTERARLMEQAALAEPGGMMAVLGVDVGTAEEMARRAGACVANDNAPGQLVLSGPDQALAGAAAAARGAGGRAVRLQVSGPFHSRAMAKVEEEFREVVMMTEIRSPRIQLISDMTARPMAAPGEIRKRLVEQLTGRVRWTDCIDTAVAAGATDFLDVGPGEVLAGLVKRCRGVPPGDERDDNQLAEAGVGLGRR